MVEKVVSCSAAQPRRGGRVQPGVKRSATPGKTEDLKALKGRRNTGWGETPAITPPTHKTVARCRGFTPAYVPSPLRGLQIPRFTGGCATLHPRLCSDTPSGFAIPTRSLPGLAIPTRPLPRGSCLPLVGSQRNWSGTPGYAPSPLRAMPTVLVGICFIPNRSLETNYQHYHNFTHK